MRRSSILKVTYASGNSFNIEIRSYNYRVITWEITQLLTQTLF